MRKTSGVFIVVVFVVLIILDTIRLVHDAQHGMAAFMIATTIALFVIALVFWWAWRGLRKQRPALGQVRQQQPVAYFSRAYMDSRYGIVSSSNDMIIFWILNKGTPCHMFK